MIANLYRPKKLLTIGFFQHKIVDYLLTKSQNVSNPLIVRKFPEICVHNM